MRPFKRILVPVDYSTLSLEAWALAKELAGRLNASLEAVYAYELPVTEDVASYSLSESERSEAQQELREQLGGAKVTVMEGPAVQAILAHAAGSESDLIVMGTHGRTGLPRVLFGSVAEGLSRFSPIPVLTLHGSWRRFSSILAPVNFTPYSLGGFYGAARLAEALGARMDALYVPEGNYSEPMLHSAFNEACRSLPPYFDPQPPKLILRRGKAAEEIANAACGYDLVSLVSHRKRMLEDLTLGTTAERVLRVCPAPVISFPFESRPAAPVAESGYGPFAVPGGGS